MAKKTHYVDNQELEDWWQGWYVTGCDFAWHEVSSRIYQICQGIATHFNPKSDEESHDHVHDAFVQILDKIQKGKLRYERGRAPVFNLVTTTVFRILYSKMNKQKKHREHLRKYFNEFILAHAPEQLEQIESPFEHKVS